MSDEPLNTDIPSIGPAEAEIEHRAEELAKADGLAWAAPGTPGQGDGRASNAASEDDRNRYRKLARERLEAERGLNID